MGKSTKKVARITVRMARVNRLLFASPSDVPSTSFPLILKGSRKESLKVVVKPVLSPGIICHLVIFGAVNICAGL